MQRGRVVISTAVHEATANQLEDVAHAQHMSISGYTRKLIEDHLAQQDAASESKTVQNEHESK